MTDLDGWKGPSQTPPPGQLGPIVAMLRKLQADVRALQNASPLRAASISEGGLVVRNGGSIRIEDGGGLSAYRPDDTHAVSLGPIYDGGTGLLTWYGLFVEDTEGEEVLAVLTRIDTGQSTITAQPTGSLLVGTGGQIDLGSAQQLYLHATGSGQNAYLYAENGGGAFVRATSGAGAVALTSAGGSATVQAGAGVIVTAGAAMALDSVGDMFLDAGDAVVIEADESAFLEAGAAGGNGNVQLKFAGTTASASRRVEIADADSLVADFDSVGMHLYQVAAIPGDTLVRRSSDSRVGISSSSRRWKQDVEDHQVDLDAILKLRGRSWRDKGEVEEHPETTNRYAGLIAEEVHELGLTEAVLYDTDGTPRNILDRPLILGLAQLAQRQQKQLDAQAAQIAALTARLDAVDGGAHSAKATRATTARTVTALAAVTETRSGDVIAIPAPAAPAVPTPRPEPPARPDQPSPPDTRPEPQEA